MSFAPHHLFSYAEYLAREAETGLKHEFLRGQVYAMAGGSPEHARLIAAVTTALSQRVPEGCRVFTSELKIRVADTGLATYPDVTVVCGALVADADDPNAVVNPTLLVEVLSPSTEAYDRGEKWSYYRRIPSLEAYVLVSQIPQRVEIYEKQPNGDFVHRSAAAGERLAVRCLSTELDIAALYAGAVA